MKIEVRISMATPDWSPFKARRIAGDGSELLIPQPADHTLCRFHTAEIRTWALRNCFALFIIQVIVCSGESASDEKNVALPEFKIMVFDHLFQLLESNSFGTQCRYQYGFACGPFSKIEQNATASDTTILGNSLYFLVNYGALYNEYKFYGIRVLCMPMTSELSISSVVCPL